MRDLVHRLHARIREVEASHEVTTAAHHDLNVTRKGLEGELEIARGEVAQLKREKNAENINAF